MASAPAVWRSGQPIEPLQDLLERGGLLGIPTESSYGLAADPRSRAGVARIFAIKGREGGKPLPVVAADLGQIESLGVRIDKIGRLAHCWPAALSVVLPLEQPLAASAGRRSLAVRIPAHDGLRRLLADLGRPLTATSANLSGQKPLLEPLEVLELLAGQDAMVIDQGRLPGGPPSTLVRWGADGLVVLRPGRFPLERVQDMLADEAIVRHGRAGESDA